jgi:hypothetical protein
MGPGGRLSGSQHALLFGCAAVWMVPGAPATADQLVIANASPAGAWALIQASRSGECISELHHVISAVDIVNLDRSRPACTSRLTVFSPGRAVEIQQPIAGVTDGGEDTMRITMSEPVMVPLRVWLMTRTEVAEHDVQLAQQLYDGNGCGIEFSSVVEDKSLEARDHGVQAADCRSLDSLAETVGFAPDAINVYYTTVPPDYRAYRGLTCPGGRALFVYGAARPETLAHELGHALGLDDWDRPSASPNVMTGGIPGVRHLTKGQCFAMSAAKKSIVNSLDVPIRQGTVLDCPHDCPPLDADHVTSATSADLP